MQTDTKTMLYKILDNMTQELEDLMREKAKSRIKDGLYSEYTRHFPRPLSERMNILLALVRLQQVFEREKWKQKGRYTD